MSEDIRISSIIAPHFNNVHRTIRQHAYSEYMLDGGRGSTKSTFISLEILLILKRNTEMNAVVLRKVTNTLRMSVYDQLMWAISAMKLDDEWRGTVSPMELINTSTGQKIIFRGLDDKRKLKSIKIAHGYFGVLWFEELDEFAGMDEIRSVDQSIARGGDKFYIFYSFNPPKSRDNWTNIEKNEIVPDRLCHHSCYLDVPPQWLGQRFIDKAEYLKINKPLVYEHEYLGIATGSGGAVFDNVESRVIADSEIMTMGTFYRGIDFGFAVDPLAWIKMSYDAKRHILYLLDEIYEPKLKTAVAVERIRKKDKHGGVTYGDCAESRTIAEMTALGLTIIPVKKGPDSVEHGIKWLCDLERIVIDRSRTPNAHREFTLYEYEIDKNGNYISAYPDKNNHAIDATRYAMSSVMQRDGWQIVN